MRKICLLGATFGTENMGVCALTAGAVKCIAGEFPGARICLLDYGRKSLTYDVRVPGGSVPVQLVNMRFSKRFYLKNNVALLILVSLLLRLVPSGRLRDMIISGNFCLAHISGSDMAASLAGGDSFSDIYGLRRFLYVSLPQLLVLFMGKRLLLLPQTLGPFKGRISRLIAGYILGRAELVYSRDHAGLDEARELMGPGSGDGKLRFCYDLGLVLDPVRPARVDLSGLMGNGKPPFIVGLNVSGLLLRGGYTRDNMFGLKTDYRRLVYGLIDYLISRRDATVLLVPHVFGTQLESDGTACREVYDDLRETYKGRLLFVEGEFDQGEIKYIIGRCEFFIGSRMHACLAALSQNIPAVSIAYSRKFRGVMETIGVGSLVADLREEGMEEVVGVLDRALNQRDAIRKGLGERMPEVREKVLGLFREMEALS